MNTKSKFKIPRKFKFSRVVTYLQFCEIVGESEAAAKRNAYCQKKSNETVTQWTKLG